MAKGRVAGLWAFWRFMKSRDSGVSLKVLALAAALYVILPADLIPDFVPFAGWLDDLGVITFVGSVLAGAYGKRKNRSAASSDEPRNTRVPRGETPREAR